MFAQDVLPGWIIPRETYGSEYGIESNLLQGIHWHIRVTLVDKLIKVEQKDETLGHFICQEESLGCLVISQEVGEEEAGASSHWQ